jgi:PAS domain S-box-containing protein
MSNIPAYAESEVFFREIAENIREVFWLFDWEKQKVIYVSPAYEAVWGRPIKDLYNRYEEWTESIYPPDRVFAQKSFQKIPDTHGGQSREYRIVRPDGTIRWVCDRGFAIRDAAGKVVRIAGIAEDITERKQAQETLRRQNLYLTALHDIALGLMSRFEVEDLLEAIVKRAGELIDTKDCFISLYDADHNDLVLRIGIGQYAEFIGFRLKPGEGMAGRVWQSGRPMVVEDYSQWSGRSTDKRFDDLVTSVGIPLKSESQVNGVIGLNYFKRARAIDEEEISALTRFAELASIAFDNAQLYSKLEHELADRKRAEKALRQSEATLKSIVRAAPTGIGMVSDRVLKQVNQRLCEMTGYSSAEMLEQSARMLYPTDNDFNWVGQEKYLQIQQRGTGTVETRWKRKDGKIIDVLLSSTPIDLDDLGTGVTFTALDITQIKQAEESLRKYEYIVATSTDLMSLLDRDYIFQAVNESFLNAYLKKRSEIIGHPVPELLGRDTFEDKVKEKLDRCLSGEKVHFTSWFNFPGWGERYVDVNYYPFYDENNQIVGVVANTRDITERKKLEGQLLQSQKMEAIGTLAGGIAHDFNNLMMGIQGRTSLMLMDVDSTHPLFEHMNGIGEYVKSASNLTRQLLGFARGGKYEVKTTNLNHLVKEQNRMFGRTKKEIRLQEKFETDLWAVEIDQIQIKQVLLNLYINAWQAMPGGGHLLVQTENVTLAEGDVKPYNVPPGRYVKMSITDTGVGMDSATRRRIFEPFFTTKERGRGTGLGLASAYGTIQNHEGFITVDSEKGEGSTFTIYLPASGKNEVGDVEEPPQKLLEGDGTILLVDDEKFVLDVSQQMIKRLGYKVMTAGSGKEALSIYGKNPDAVDIVILDLIMPDLDGDKTYDRLKQIDPHVKVLLSSGYSINGKATEILNRGCNGFIQKPFNLNVLSMKISEILNEK